MPNTKEGCSSLKHWISLWTGIGLFLLTHAFASPTDMASSSVKENIILAITPTLDGVCGMLLYIILDFDFFDQNG